MVVAARPWLLVALGGCQAVFSRELSPDAEVEVDAVAGNDEDRDGVDDAMDLCPSIPNGGADRDRDGVGDECDPRPDEPGDRIVHFDPFERLDQNWELVTGEWFTSAGALVQESRASETLLAFVTPLKSPSIQLMIGSVTELGNHANQVGVYLLTSEAPTATNPTGVGCYETSDTRVPPTRRFLTAYDHRVVDPVVDFEEPIEMVYPAEIFLKAHADAGDTVVCSHRAMEPERRAVVPASVGMARVGIWTFATPANFLSATIYAVD